MAITKRSIAQGNNQSAQQRVKAAEAKIDKHLDSHYLGQGGVIIPSIIINAEKPGVLAALKALYPDWTIELKTHYDDREGNWTTLTFS